MGTCCADAVQAWGCRWQGKLLKAVHQPSGNIHRRLNQHGAVIAKGPLLGRYTRTSMSDRRPVVAVPIGLMTVTYFTPAAGGQATWFSDIVTSLSFVPQVTLLVSAMTPGWLCRYTLTPWPSPMIKISCV